MWDGMYPTETDQALQARLQFPEPEAKPRAGAWAQIGELVKAPYQGFAQGLNQSLRVVSQVATARPGEDPADRKAVGLGLFPEASKRIDADRQAARAKNEQLGKDADEYLRNAVDFWNPDPVASTTASMVLQQGARVLTKVAGYSMLGGAPGAIVGTGVDEGATGYLELRDKGVDKATAAKVGAVRGAAMAAGVALPVVGSTALQTAGLIAVGGPVSFMAEQALSRDILETAQYPELAKQYDPLDPLGLTLSIAIPGTIGAAAHAIRLRKPGPAALADSAEHLNAAHVAYRDEQLKAGTLAEPANGVAMEAHAAQLRAAAKSMEDGQRVEVPGVEVEPMRAEAVMREVVARVEAQRPEIEAAARDRQVIEGVRGRLPEPSHVIDFAEQTYRARELFQKAEEGGFLHRSDGFETFMNSVRDPDEVKNLVAGLWEAGPLDRQRGESVLRDFSRAARDPAMAARKNLTDMAADVVEAHRRGSTLTPEPALAARAVDQVIERRPDLPVRLDEVGPPVAARDVVEQVRSEVARDRQDSRAFMAAIECALRSGS